MIMITIESYYFSLSLFSMTDLVLRVGSWQGPRRVLSVSPGRTPTPSVLIALFWDKREGTLGRRREASEQVSE